MAFVRPCLRQISMTSFATSSPVSANSTVAPRRVASRSNALDPDVQIGKRAVADGRGLGSQPLQIVELANRHGAPGGEAVHLRQAALQARVCERRAGARP